MVNLGTAASNATTAWQGWNEAWMTSTAAMTTATYNPIQYTTTYTMTVTSAADNAYWGGWNAHWTETDESRIRREQALERERATRDQALTAAQRYADNRVAAEAVARELLVAHLDAQQKRDLLEHRWFEVISNKGRRWRIRVDGYVGNVDLMPAEGNTRLASYCAHASENLPASDHHLVQKMVLETAEEDFIAVANVHFTSPGVPAEQIPDRRRRYTPDQIAMIALEQPRVAVA